MDIVDMNRVLIIEDNKVMAKILGQLLRKCLRLQTISHAPTTQAAYNALSKTMYDCIFLDLNLSTELDGIPVLVYIKQQYPELPVIIVSGENEMNTVKKVLALKPNGYLVKPLSMQKLQNCLTKIFKSELILDAYSAH
ncbi:response regulator [Vibrio sp. 10N.286.49.B3]|uniref:response regulator n=1 Tax=Vibrio sp. 10N.286.49.B3 TaxID=1880855 RepID=UPI000C82FA66|nr:response regulator [Vibrio sp. 10N.286.49.B3]